MIQWEIMRTCSHDKVAEAAVLSLGAAFHRRMSLLAATVGQTPGAYVATLVRRFAHEAGPHELMQLARAVAGADMPILAGLRWIVETTLDGERPAGADDRPAVAA